MQYLLLGLVLAIIIASVVGWMKITGGVDGVADAELIDISDGFDLPARNDRAARHAVMTVASRHIPLISLRRGPHVGQAWLHYADGTELLVEERVLGPLGLLASDLAMYGPTPRLSISPRPDDFWVSVGRKDTQLRVLDGRHPETLVDI